jgi:hypothetical protein
MTTKPKNKPLRLKARDEVMLLHLIKTFKCGAHKNDKVYDRKDKNYRKDFEHLIY